MNNDYRLPDMAKARLRRPYQPEYIRNPYILDEEDRSIGKGSFYHLLTYGCQGNVRDSETIAGILQDMGYASTDDVNKADVIIMNTCAIRENAENRVIGMLGSLQAVKRVKPDLIVGLCGCMAQEEEIARLIVEKHPIVDILFGTHNIYRLPELIKKVRNEHKRAIEVLSIQGNIYENLPAVRSQNHKAFVSIMEGCDKFCTYCIVPYTRGQQRSRKSADILDECRQLVDGGYKEITLIGQNVNAYGKDLHGEDDFASLMGKVSDLGVERIRFTTSHPWDFTDDMINMIASRSNIMPFIHLPLQSGNDEILKLMGRRYTREEYLALYDKIVSTIDDCAVSTDIIVGFPNETEEQFLDTMSVVEHCGYDNVYSFIFSPRRGTPAARMHDETPLAEKKDRLYRLNERIDYYSKLRNQERVGRVEKVLVDGLSKTNEKILSGYTEQQKLVNFENVNGRIGDIINVLITDAKKNSLDGKQII
ncbi:MAG: tRNA (N6-isopentenyl adenosine(37)-C2)-methylthiotransferase MiaB [Erysipelotrichaceae bacterium]|nr:tRNA (N6-isopentenyl adenosine(37)-C2)-methylthiotransferase MiaB [Erysipelotrichaceae bacterium]